jgi:hypothetical protein
VTDLTPARATFLAEASQLIDLHKDGTCGPDAPISTPRPFIPTMRTLEVAIFFMAALGQLGHSHTDPSPGGTRKSTARYDEQTFVSQDIT